MGLLWVAIDYNSLVHITIDYYRLLQIIIGYRKLLALGPYDPHKGPLLIKKSKLDAGSGGKKTCENILFNIPSCF